MENHLTQQDPEQLRSLAIAFRVVCGLAATCVNVAWFHVFIGFQIANTPSRSKSSDVIAPIFGYFFSTIALSMILGCYVVAYFGFKTASALEERRNWKICMGTSIAVLFAQPLGTVLGILSLIVLHRPSVKQSFTQ